MTHLAIQSSVTKTTTFAGAGVDVSGVGAAWTFKIHIKSFSPNTGSVRLVLEDTVNNFTAYLAASSFSFLGGLASANDKVHSVKAQDFPSLANSIGQSGGQLRLRLSEITGSSPSVTYDAWLEY